MQSAAPGCDRYYVTDSHPTATPRGGSLSPGREFDPRVGPTRVAKQSLGERTLEWTHAGTESCQRRDTIDKQAEAPTSMLPLAPPAISHDHVSLGAMSAGFQSGSVTLASQKKVAS